MVTTKLTVEITVSTQFGPADAINLVDVITRIAAIKQVDIVKLETDYVGLKEFPEDVNFKAMCNIPCKIR